MRRREEPARAWVLASAVPMVRRIAERHGREQGLGPLEVEWLDCAYLRRLTPRFVDSLVRIHGSGRSPARLYAHLESYLGRAKGLSARYAATRARTWSLDEEDAPQRREAIPGGDAFDALLSELQERDAAVEREAELLYRQWVVHDAARRERAARAALGPLLAGDRSASADTVRRRVAGRSPAEIAAEDGVTENAVNARLSRWLRRLSPAERAAVAPLAIVRPNPRKARRR